MPDLPRHIRVEGARQHNLQNIYVSHPARQAGGHHRPERVGQELAGLRHHLRRGPAEVRREPLGLRPAVPRAARRSPTSSTSRACRRPSPSSSGRAASNPRSTVATTTEIYDYLRLLFARVGEPHCWVCGRPIDQQTATQIVDTVMAWPRGHAVHGAGPAGPRRRRASTPEVLRHIAAARASSASASTASCTTSATCRRAGQEPQAHHRGGRGPPGAQAGRGAAAWPTASSAGPAAGQRDRCIDRRPRQDRNVWEDRSSSARATPAREHPRGQPGGAVAADVQLQLAARGLPDLRRAGQRSWSSTRT